MPLISCTRSPLSPSWYDPSYPLNDPFLTDVLYEKGQIGFYHPCHNSLVWSINSEVHGRPLGVFNYYMIVRLIEAKFIISPWCNFDRKIDSACIFGSWWLFQQVIHVCDSKHSSSTVLQSWCRRHTPLRLPNCRCFPYLRSWYTLIYLSLAGPVAGTSCHSERSQPKFAKSTFVFQNTVAAKRRSIEKACERL